MLQEPLTQYCRLGHQLLISTFLPSQFKEGCDGNRVSYQESFVCAIIRCYILFLALAMPTISGCQGQEAETAKRASWQSSFHEFLREVCILAQKAKPPNAQEMQTRLNEIWVMTDGAGYVIDCNSPSGTLQCRANFTFANKHFVWNIPVKNAEWSDSSHSSVFFTLALDDAAMDRQQGQAPKSVSVRLYGEKQLPSSGILKVRGILHKPEIVVAPESAVKQGTLPQECWLSGVCVIYFPDNKEDEYELLLVLNGRWGRYDSVRREKSDH